MQHEYAQITKDHLTAFGAIVMLSARLENLMMIAITGLIGHDLGTGYIVTTGLSYQWTRDALRALNYTMGLTEKRKTELKSIINEIDSKQALRNAIAHNVWENSDRPGAIRPMQLKFRNRRGEPIVPGYDADAPDYTLNELINHATELEDTCTRFSTFLRDSGLADIIAEKTETISWTTSSSNGDE